MRKILSFSPLTTHKTGLSQLNSLTFKPAYYARFPKKNDANNQKGTQSQKGSKQDKQNEDSPQGNGDNMKGQQQKNNSKIKGPNKFLNMVKNGNINILPFYMNHMVKKTRNPSLPMFYFQQPLPKIKPKQPKPSNTQSPQAKNQTSTQSQQPQPQTHIVKDFAIKSSNQYSKILMKKYRILNSLKGQSKKAQSKQKFSYFKMFEQDGLRPYLRDPDTTKIVYKFVFYSVLVAAFLMNFIRKSFETVQDPTEYLHKYTDLSDSDIHSRINQIKEIRVQSNRFRDYEMVVVLKEQKKLNIVQKFFDSLGFNIEKNKILVFDTQNPNLILDGLQKAQQNKQQIDWIKIKPIITHYSPYDAFWDTLMLATPFLGIALTYWIFTKVNPDSMMKGLTSNKKSMKIESTKDIKVRFKDVAGMENSKKEITQFVDFLKNSEKYVEMGARIPKGALLTGPPGTGKTMLAKACAGQAGTSFFYVSGSEFVQMFVGLGASRVRQLFAKARQQAPSIIFIDEIDAIGKKRESSRNEQKDSTLNQMLVEMDGFSTSETVIVLAATNRKDILDSALTRPGRFDRMVEITLPELKARQEIFMVHLTPLKINPNRPLNEIAQRLASLTPGFSGADIANLCNEAAIIATRKKRQYIEDSDFEEASERIMAGYVKKGLSNEKTKKRVAYHEAGHAVCGWYLKGGDPLVKLTIIPRSKGALGYAQYLPKTAYIRTKSELTDSIAIMLGGTTSEQIFLGGMSSGNSDDLQKVYSTARRMVTQYGMGARTYNMTLDEQTYVKKESEKLCNTMDGEMLQLVNQGSERAKNIINEKRDIVEQLAKELLEKETLNNEDILRIMGQRPAFN